jgi:DNA-binding CsgD family transcriptional regulator
MAQFISPLVADILAEAPPLPLDAVHWQKIVRKLGLSNRQAGVVELMLRDLSDKQIALVQGISESTVTTHQERIRYRTGTRGRMQLAMHVLAVSREVDRST